MSSSILLSDAARGAKDLFGLKLLRKTKLLFFAAIAPKTHLPRRYDTRNAAHDEARHWSDDSTLAGRAFFRGDHNPSRLVLDNVRDTDQAIYKCRVDFKVAPTRISRINLNVIGEIWYILRACLFPDGKRWGKIIFFFLFAKKQVL